MTQHKASHRETYKIAEEGTFGFRFPQGICDEINRKFKQWEIRRGLVTEQEVAQREQQSPKLRGAALKSTIQKKQKTKGVLSTSRARTRKK